MKELKIIPYEQQYHLAYKKLSLEWLEKFDLFEEADRPMIENPKETILNKGGFIFLARYNDTIVGTIALKKVNNNSC